MGTLLPVTYVARFSCGLFLCDISDDTLLRTLQNTTLVLDDKFLLYDEFFSRTPTYCPLLLEYSLADKSTAEMVPMKLRFAYVWLLLAQTAPKFICFYYGSVDLRLRVTNMLKVTDRWIMKYNTIQVSGLKWLSNFVYISKHFGSKLGSWFISASPGIPKKET